MVFWNLRLSWQITGLKEEGKKWLVEVSGSVIDLGRRGGGEEKKLTVPTFLFQRMLFYCYMHTTVYIYCTYILLSFIPRGSTLSMLSEYFHWSKKVRNTNVWAAEGQLLLFKDICFIFVIYLTCRATSYRYTGLLLPLHFLVSTFSTIAVTCNDFENGRNTPFSSPRI